MLLDWLSNAEMKLRYAGSLPTDEDEARQQIAEHEAFMLELRQKEKEKNETIAFAEEILAKAHPDAISTIKHWINIIQSRWEEAVSWAEQRDQRLQEHFRTLVDLQSLMDELMRWLTRVSGPVHGLALGWGVGSGPVHGLVLCQVVMRYPVFLFNSWHLGRVVVQQSGVQFMGWYWVEKRSVVQFKG